jgi:TPR repeat protein
MGGIHYRVRRLRWRGLAVLAVMTIAGGVQAEDATAPLPAEVNDALQRMVAAQQSGDLKKYGDTLASPVAEVFRLHTDSATKVGEAKRYLGQVLGEVFGTQGGADPFSYAFDDQQLKLSLQRLVSMQIDQAAPSGNNWKLQVTTTVRMPDGSTRQIPQGFIAVQYGNTWKVQDLAMAAHLAAQRQGAETNWAIYRMFNTIADEVKAGKFQSGDQAVARALAAYKQITDADAAPPQGRDEYLAAEKAFNVGDFARSLELFKRSAEKGYPHAACMVAIQYSAGEGTKEDAAAAVEWFRKDIARHDATAENFLGSMMLEGDGAPKDPAQGMRLLQLAAEQDNPAAFLNIGRAYLFGLGVPKDPNLGMEYYNRAAELGNAQAAYFVKWLGQAAGNRSFKDQNQATAYQQIQLLRANALIAEQSGFRSDGSYRAANAQGAANLRAQADQLARENGLD